MSTTEAAPRPPDSGITTRVTLVAVVTVLVVDVIRASGPMLYRVFSTGAGPVIGVALAVYLVAPGVLAAAALALTRRRDGMPDGATVLLAVAALGVARLVTQLVSDQARVVAGLAAAALAVTALVLTVCRATGRHAGGRQAAIGIMLGIGLSVGVQTVLRTWDPLWRGGLVGVVWALALALIALSLAVVTRKDAGQGRPRRTWALGPALALIVMVLANPAFVAAQSGAGLVLACAVLVAGAAATVWLLLVPGVLTPVMRVCCAVALPVLAAATLLLPDVAALVCAGVGQIAFGVVLGGSLSARRSAPPGIARTAVATAGVGAALVLVLLVYLLDYELPFSFDHAWLVVAGAILLALSGLRRRTPGMGPRVGAGPVTPPLRANALRLLVLPSILLLVVGWWRPWVGDAPTAATQTESLRVLDWNLHDGIGVDTRVDLEQIARTIEQQQPDVVTLQAVCRGWVLGGGTDMATWLAERLDMQVAFSPADDGQSGSVLLSRTPLTDVQVIDLPSDQGQRRPSALTARVQSGDGSWVRVTSVQLQDQDADARLEEVTALVAALPEDGPSVLAGDLRAEPDQREPQLLIGAGWVSAIDAVGDPDVLTSLSADPQTRTDWVFGQQVSFTEATVLDSDASDHRAVVVEAALG